MRRMKENKKIALVTGANRGIGFEACRQLSKNGFKVILTSRKEAKGKEATEKLKKEGLDLSYHQLDVTNKKGIKNIYSYVKKEFGKLDVLVNNAGILLDHLDESKNDKDSDYGISLDDYPEASIFKIKEEVYKKTLDVNFFGSMNLCKAFIPTMIKNDYGRIVNISSGMGQLSDMGGGWPAYRLSKTALNVLTRILADETRNYNILINSMCPGWVKTDMGGPNATRSPKQATETIVWLATLLNGGSSGSFFRDKKKIEW